MSEMEVDKDTMIKEQAQDDYLDTYALWHNYERKLIREIEKEGKIPKCKNPDRLDDHPPEKKTVYNKEKDRWECPYSDCGQIIYTSGMKPPPR